MKLKRIILPAITCLTISLQGLAEGSTYYSVNFKASTPADIGLTTIDANNDGTTWTTAQTEQTFRALDGQTIEKVDKYAARIEKNADDWLLTPGIRFEAGKTYKAHFVMSKYWFAAMDNCFEIKLGTSRQASSMTTEIVPLTGFPEYGGNSLWSFDAVISVETTGDYYVGVHATNNPQNFGIVELTIENGVGLATPEAITDLTVTPDPTGDKKATISFTTPTRAKDGAALTSLSKIEIRRNGDLVKTIDNPAPGSRQSFETLVAVNGLYTFSAIAFTEGGGGDAATATAFIGINIPSPATDVKSANLSNTSARITWNAPLTDRDGYAMPAAAVKYDVVRAPLYKNSEAVTIASGLTATSYDDSSLTEGDSQQFYIYKVIASTSEGAAEAAEARPLPLGKPYAAPYNESFAGGQASNIYTSTPVGNVTTNWLVTRDIEDLSSFDHDNGMIFLYGYIHGEADLLQGLIDLSTIEAPTLSYYTYNITDCDPEDNRLGVTIIATDGTTRVVEPTVPGMGWTQTLVPLYDFAGKTVRLIFNGVRRNNTELHLDNIAISTIYTDNLKAEAIRLPEKIKSSEPYDVIVDVLNIGSKISGDYSVDLYCDGVKAATKSGGALEIGARNSIVFEQEQGILAPETIEYYAVVNYDGDCDTADNTTETVSAKVLKNSYPKVADLTGTTDGTTVTLTWGEPDTSKAQPYETLDTFDTYPSWANKNVGDWTFVDKDKAQIAGFTEGVMPGIDNYSQQSWWVFDNSIEDFGNGSFATLSGSKFLASMVSGIKGENRYVQNDDWAISPRLFGGIQTITVNARSYGLTESEFESFELLYSTGSLEPDDFISLAKFEQIPNEYKAYQADLPDGALYFAIRNISLGKYVLMVDDVTYTPVGEPGAFTINGYNVYRDGVRINSEPVEENEYVDTTAGEGNHRYNVTVLYSAGESMFSNDYIVGEGAITTITGEGNTLLDIYNIQGICLTRGATADTLPALAPGVYLVNNGVRTVKIIVR